jgi:hypothetical protein
LVGFPGGLQTSSRAVSTFWLHVGDLMLDGLEIGDLAAECATPLA